MTTKTLFLRVHWGHTIKAYCLPCNTEYWHSRDGNNWAQADGTPVAPERVATLYSLFDVDFIGGPLNGTTT